MKACAVGAPNEEHDGLYLLLICKKGEVPRMAQLNKCFGVEIVSYVEFMAEITDFKFQMNSHPHSESSHGESSRVESSHGESSHGDSSRVESSHGESSHGELSSPPKQCPAMCVMPGDGIYEANEGDKFYGTIGFFVRINNKQNLATCYHVCYHGNKLPEDLGKRHQILSDDVKDKKSSTRTGTFWSLPRRERKEEQSQKDVEEKKERKMPEQKEGERDEQNQNFDERQEQETKKPEGETKELKRKDEKMKLGSFLWGKYDNGHDICFVEQAPDAKCVCQIPAGHPEENIRRKKEIVSYIDSGFCTVEKTGYHTGTTTGRVRGFNYCDLGTSVTTDLGLLVEDEDPKQPFASPGDSGSLVSLMKHKEKIPIAYLKTLATAKENGGNEVDVHFCYFLVELLRECREDEKVRDLQLYLTGCVCNGPAFIKNKKRKKRKTKVSSMRK